MHSYLFQDHMLFPHRIMIGKDSAKVLPLISDSGVLLATISYYGRLVSYVVILLFLVEAVNQVPQSTVTALKPIILFCLLLITLICLKFWTVDGYDTMRWFCTPGIVFLKSWTSLFFFVYLVQLPYYLSAISPIQIVSWVSQIIISNLITLATSSLISTYALVFFDKFLQDGDNKPQQNPDSTTGDVESKNTGPNAMDGSSPSLYSARITEVNNRPSMLTNSNNALLRKSYVENRFIDHLLMDSSAEYATDEFTSTFSSRVSCSAGNGTNAHRNDDRNSQSILHRASQFNIASEPLPFNEEFTFSPAHLRVSFSAHGRASATEMVRLTHGQRDSNVQLPQNTTGTVSGRNVFSTLNPITEDLNENAKSVDIVFDSQGNRIPSTDQRTVSTVPVVPEIEEKDAEESVALPFIPTIDQIFNAWCVVLLGTALISFLMVRKSKGAIIAFQIAANVLIFILASSYRMKLIGRLHWTLQTLLQSPVIFTPLAIFVVFLSADGGWSQWSTTSENFLASKTLLQVNEFGAGNFLSVFLDAAIISLAFSTVEPILQYSTLMLYLTPFIVVICALVYIFAAVLSLICQSPSTIALPLLTHSITTPIALAVSAITGGSPGLTAATPVFNGVIGLRVDSYILDYFGIKQAPVRGVSMAITGTLLGVVALDERNETLAASMGMAAYAIATMTFALLMAIPPFESFIVGLT